MAETMTDPSAAASVAAAADQMIAESDRRVCRCHIEQPRCGVHQIADDDDWERRYSAYTAAVEALVATGDIDSTTHCDSDGQPDEYELHAAAGRYADGGAS